MKWFKKFWKRDRIKNRKVTRARFLYLYIIFGSITGLVYFITSLVIGLPKHWAFTPVYLLAALVAYRFLRKNWKLLWLYVRDVEQGRLLLFLNEHTHFEETHKLKLINWVYLRRRTIRQETKLAILKKFSDGIGLSNKEMKMLKFKVVFCPQQLKESFNEAVLVNALIFAHENIQILDDELRSIMELTDNNMLAFDLNAEYKKCTDDKYKKLMKVGKNIAERLNEKP